MTILAPIRRPLRPANYAAPRRAYVLVAVIFMLAVLTIALALAIAPRLQADSRDRRTRDHAPRQVSTRVPSECINKKFGAYPPNLDALAKPTNNIRFLRKKYIDPTHRHMAVAHPLAEQGPQPHGFFGPGRWGTSMYFFLREADIVVGLASASRLGG